MFVVLAMKYSCCIDSGVLIFVVLAVEYIRSVVIAYTCSIGSDVYEI